MIVYGVNNCPETNAAIRNLKAKKIPYTSPRHQRRCRSEWAGARRHLIYTGYPRDKTCETSIIEVDGYARPRLPSAEVEARLKKVSTAARPR